MRNYGFLPSELAELKKLLQKHFGDLTDVKVYLFGSRAKGDHKKFSDVDLAIQSKSKDVSSRIAQFQSEWEESRIPYRLDVTNWKDVFKPYLPEIRRTRKILWQPEDRELHPWRVCPYGQHWVVRHPRLPVGRQLQDVDGHCRKNPSNKDQLDGQEIEFISSLPDFLSTKPLPGLYVGKVQIKNSETYDHLIAGWCRYWNEILKPQTPIDVGFVKALMHSESTFDPMAQAKNKNKRIGMARGLIQITEQTWRILKDRKGEIKDHYIDLKKEELFEPSKNICASIRWIFWKRELLKKKLKAEPEWVDVMINYKALRSGLTKKNPTSLRILNEFNAYWKMYSSKPD